MLNCGLGGSPIPPRHRLGGSAVPGGKPMKPAMQTILLMIPQTNLIRSIAKLIALSNCNLCEFAPQQCFVVQCGATQQGGL
jgi:hypothetical protein